MKRLTVTGLSLLLAAASVQAATPRYRIDLRGGGHVFSRDLPVRNGSVLIFHQLPGGVLTGIPQESVLGIESATSKTSGSAVTHGATQRSRADVAVRGNAAADQTPGRPLEPGEALMIGPTGGASAQLAGQAGGATAGAPMPGATNAGTTNPALGASAVAPGYSANGQPFVPAPGDLARAPSAGAPPTMGSNGLPVTANPTTINVGPNGTPLVLQSGTASTTSGTTQTNIGSNGTPVLSQPGTAGATPPVIGPNGTPVLAQPGTPGAAPANIGPNGTPVLAQPGAPGSTPPAIAPNGTPATGPAGTPSSAQPNTAPNGTPASPPPAGSPSPKG